MDRSRSSEIKVETPSMATTTTATDDEGGNRDAVDDYVVDDYCNPPKEEPKSECIDLYYPPIKEEPEPELGCEDGDDVNDYYDCDPPKDEPDLVAVGDYADVDSGPDVGYDCCHCGISLGTRKFKVEHELRCKIRMEQKEFESQVTEVYHCGYCRCPFVNEEHKEQHQQKYCRKRPVAKRKCSNSFRCDECEFVTKWKHALGRHILTHNKNSVEWFTCSQCSYKTLNKYNLYQHTKIHNNTFSYCCPICGKGFRSKQALDHHLVKLHSDEWDEVAKLITSKIYTCDICDKYRTTKKTEYNEHLTVTHLKGVGRQKYECPRCPYSTFIKGHLTRHSKSHADQKDYQCAACKKQFALKVLFDSHVLHNHADNEDLMKTITSKIHSCESCSFKTLITTRLKSHVRSKHV